MSDQVRPDEYEEDVRQWLRPLGGDAAVADGELLRSLRERSLAAFADPVAAATSPAPIASPLERTSMSFIAYRVAAAVAACAAAIAVWLAGGFLTPARGSVTLGDVLRRTEQAQSLHLEVRRGGERSEVWVKQPGLVRWEDSPQVYLVSRGSQLWRVNEAANEVSEGEPPWHVNEKDEFKDFDLLTLLETAVELDGDLGLSDFEHATSRRQEEYLGRTCLVFELEAPHGKGRVRLLAYADVESLELQGLVARPAGGRLLDDAPPLAEIRLVAINAAVDESKFVVAKSVLKNSRIGKVIDVQGTVALQPPLAQRWTPVCGPASLRPGDWVRTDIRGANAVRIALSSQVELTLGPGGLVEFLTPHQVRLHSGELRAKVAKGVDQSFELLGNDKSSESLSAGREVVFRAVDAKPLAQLKHKPDWLAGFEGTGSNESLGSLIAMVDGRNVPLSVGTHKVQVDIRDQIARTTIEESFVNHTGGRLEGVFYFPLPAEASISGFGMWIGGELVEADVVEKQRAREIYETILRERRDPGLLEWTSGNLFKARVFPIEPRSEKRIKLTYTQVLPLRDNRYVYNYGLRSELLRSKPLRELAIDVRVSSELPLRSIACPTHTVRSDKTDHAARVEFTAQEYTPTRDFEVVCEIDGRQSDVVVIPHQRGEDGYFLVQLTPPAAAGNWRRDVLPEGEPIELALVCDTSGSIDRAARQQQREFAAAALGSLGPEDRFNLAVCDVDCQWAIEGDAGAPDKRLVPATKENVARALELLDQRKSLGWTDLDATFAKVLASCGERTQVVYLGDGVPAAGDADPQELVNRLRRQYGETPRGVWHAVSVGNIHETTVLKAIGGLGGGSVRSIGGEQTPQAAALELLREITEPGLRDLRVEFDGVAVAAVYPEQLPNLSAGSQQILTGRYLPRAAAQAGELIVTGNRGEETVRYATSVRFPKDNSVGGVSDADAALSGRVSPKLDASFGETGPQESASETPPTRDSKSQPTEDVAGNSFIPRLWARAHLDHLLAQGASQAIQDEIIALSEEFHIITPYTSLLVLETDADRERFGVRRRFLMRDGERFFAEGRDNAAYELVQQQMRRAAGWRMQLRQQILARLATLGRDESALGQLSGVTTLSADMGGVMGDNFSFGMSFSRSGGVDLNRPSSGMHGGSGGGGYGGGSGPAGAPMAGKTTTTGVDFAYANGRYLEEDLGSYDRYSSVDNSLTGLANADFDAADVFGGDKLGVNVWPVDGLVDAPMGQSEFKMKDLSGPWGGAGGLGRPGLQPPLGEIWSELGKRPRGFAGNGVLTFWSRRSGRSRWDAYAYQSSTQWVETLFPPLPARVRVAKPQASAWPEEAVAIAKSLVRTTAFGKLEGGVELRRTTDGRDPLWDRMTSHSEQLELYSPGKWLTRPLDEGGHTVVNWRNAQERGVLSLAFLLGRVRPVAKSDDREMPLGLTDDSLVPLHEVYPQYKVRVERIGDDRVTLILTPSQGQPDQTRLTIDVRRNVLVKREQEHNGKTRYTTTFDDFVEVGGVWWARRIVTTNADGEVTGETTQSVTLLGLAAFDERLAAELAPRKSALVLQLPVASLDKAKAAAAGGSASVEERLVLLLDYVSRQQWEEAFKQLEAIESLAKSRQDAPNSPDQVRQDKADPRWRAWSGLRWVRLALEQAARRNETVREGLLAEAQRLVEAESTDELYVAGHLLNASASIAHSQETLELLEKLRPVFDAQPERVGAQQQFQQRRVDLLRSLGRTEEMLELHRELADVVPWDVSRQTAYANDLATAGRRAAAYEWLQAAIDRNGRRDSGEINTLVFAYADMLHSEGRYGEEAAFLAKRVEQRPEDPQVYARLTSAWVFADDLERAETLVREWLAAGRKDEDLDKADLARLGAAIDYARGERYNLQVQRTEEHWLEPLAEMVLHFATNDKHADLAQRIMNDGRFTDSDECDGVRKELFERLRAGADTLSPHIVQALVSWTTVIPKAPGDDAWKQLAATLRQRWENAADLDQRHALSAALATIYTVHFTDSEYLEFLRARIEKAEGHWRTQYVTELFSTLLARPWSEAHEAEAVALLEELTEADNPVDRLVEQLPAVYRLVDRLIESRIESARLKLQTEGHPEKLTRTELAAKEAEFVTAAPRGVAERLAHAEDGAPEGLARWLRLERLTLQVRLEERLAEAAEACWQALGDKPARIAEATPVNEADEVDFEAETKQMRAAILDSLYRERMLATATYLAVRRDAAPELRDRLLKYIDAGIALQDNNAVAWRGAKHDLLVALDRPDDLDHELRTWIAADGAMSPWRIALGRLLAERGRLDEAIGVFEAVRASDTLTPGDLSALADWYQAVDRRADYQQTKVAVYETMEEWNLRQSIDNGINYWRRTDVELPSQLDENVLLVFQALFRKSATPGSYVYLLRDYYAACRDFRLLRMVPDSVTGRTQQQVYSFLESLDGQLLDQLREEATADEINARIVELRASTRSALDRRALDLLEAMIERRAAEVPNQPGPHAEAALAALERAFREEWAEGERLQMAQLLAKLGKIAVPSLAEEQQRELGELHAQSAPQSLERLQIGAWLAHSMFWSYDQQDAGLALLEAEAREFESASDGVWPGTATEPLSTYLAMLERRNRYADAETFVRRLAEHPETPQMATWYADRLDQIFLEALEGDGRVSLGSGGELYRNLLQRLNGELATDDHDRRYQVATKLLDLFVRANAKASIATAKADLRAFAFETLPGVLERQTSNYESLIEQTADRLKEIIGPRDGLEFLVMRLESYPPRLDMSWQSAWNRFGWRIADWKAQAGDDLGGNLSQRLLTLVVAELKRDLRERNAHNRTIYQLHSGQFWEQQSASFAAAAGEVLRERQHSGRAVKYVAAYLWDGLWLRGQAIEALLAAHREGLLDVDGQRQLVDYLHHPNVNRHGESIAVLEPLTTEHPEDLWYRTHLMTAYHATEQPAQLTRLLAETDAYFHLDGRWTEGAMATLAEACWQTKLYEQAVGYYDEAIALHQRQQPNRGVGGDTLPRYFRGLAAVHSALGHTEQAVDAASSAVVSWGPRHEQRTDALTTLTSVIDNAKDLDAFVVKLDEKAEKSGEDSPLIRRLVGKAFATKEQREQAERQLRLAIELEPNDIEAREALLNVLVDHGNNAAAAEVLIAMIELNPRNFTWYVQLTDLLKADPVQAERAATSIVEASPQEAENHAALAELRQTQDRWADALMHWRHVARIRSLEPDGLLKSAVAQVHLAQWDDAEATVATLSKTTWPSRFSAVPGEIERLKQQIAAGRDR